MKELGITKGELTAKSFYLELEEVKQFSKLTPTGIEDDTESVFDFAEKYSKAKNIELLERYNEAIEVLEKSLKVLKEFAEEQEYSVGEVDEDVSELINQIEQTISKSK